MAAACIACQHNGNSRQRQVDIGHREAARRWPLSTVKCEHLRSGTCVKGFAGPTVGYVVWVIPHHRHSIVTQPPCSNTPSRFIFRRLAQETQGRGGGRRRSGRSRGKDGARRRWRIARAASTTETASSTRHRRAISSVSASASNKDRTTKSRARG